MSNGVVHIRSTLKSEVREYPSFSPYDIGLLFGNIATPVGVILNHNNSRECSDPEYVSEVLQLIDTPQWVGFHMNLTLDRPKGEIFPIIAKLLEDKALEDGEEYEYIPMEAEGSLQFSTPKKGEEPVIPQLTEHIKSL